MKIFCRDWFLTHGRADIRECMALERSILRNFPTTLYSPQNRIFLIVSTSCLIFQEIFLAGIKRSRIFLAALGGSPVCTNLSDKGEEGEHKGAPASLSLDVI